MKRETLYRLTRWLLARLTITDFIGSENIPPTGGVILATNHLSRIDIPLLFVNPVRPDITALVADKYQRYAFMRWFTITAGGIWIDRSKADFQAFRLAADIIKEGRALGIAPEGTRSDEGGLLEGKSGTALLALRTGVPVVPVGIFGTENSVPRILTLQRPHLTANFGKPIVFEPLSRENREQQLQIYTDEIMCQIAALLPAKYRGAYAKHPRLKQLTELSQPIASVIQLK